jgi:hypothetical protein
VCGVWIGRCRGYGASGQVRDGLTGAVESWLGTCQYVVTRKLGTRRAIGWVVSVAFASRSFSCWMFPRFHRMFPSREKVKTQADHLKICCDFGRYCKLTNIQQISSLELQTRLLRSCYMCPNVDMPQCVSSCTTQCSHPKSKATLICKTKQVTKSPKTVKPWASCAPCLPSMY